jgi:hypothetical protein
MVERGELPSGTCLLNKMEETLNSLRSCPSNVSHAKQILPFGGYFRFFLSSGAGAQQISRELAAELIAEANQIRSADITIGPIHSVERKMDTTTTLLGGVCVTFIAPEIKDGRRRRVTLTRTFFYDKEWGWYLYALETDRGGDIIDIVSQHKGRLILR